MSVATGEPQSRSVDTYTWVRWGESKWHLLGWNENGQNRQTVCGERPAEPLIVSPNGGPAAPQDALDVCLHCLRWQEKFERNKH